MGSVGSLGTEWCDILYKAEEWAVKRQCWIPEEALVGSIVLEVRKTTNSNFIGLSKGNAEMYFNFTISRK